MRIASYNLYNGAQDTYPLLKTFASNYELDMICLQETNGWKDGSPSRAKEFGPSVRMPYSAYGDSNTQYDLATFSRVPLLAPKIVTKGLWHSAVRTTVAHDLGLIDVWNVHLDPKDEDRRLEEVLRLIRQMPTHKHTIITGDFNSLSRIDNYPDSLINELAKQGITKFGTHALRYDVTDHLAQAGFIDIAAKLSKNVPTVPTPANEDMFHAAPMRLDNMFVSAGLLSAVRSVEVIKTPLTDRISDHYPLVAEI